MTTIVMKALKQLEISQLNTRKVEPKHIEELAALIKARRDAARAEGREDHGLIFPLQIVPGTGKGKKKKDGVVDGGRRYRALMLLVSQGEVADTELFPTVERTAAEAVEISLMANHHEAMHPMDQADAMMVLLADGKTEAQLAHSFGLPLQTVRQRLKLANCSDRLKDEYRNGNLTIEQMVAFALSNDHAEQNRIFDVLGDDASAYQIKNAITADEAPVVGNKQLALVGVDAYLAAGGTIRPDMFNPAGGYVENVSLLRELSAAKQQAVVEELNAEGWDFVLIESQIHAWKYPEVEVDFSDRFAAEQKATIAALQADLDEKDAAAEALEKRYQDDEEGEMDYDEYDAESDRLREICDAAQEALDSATEAANAQAWTAEERATCGVLIFLDDDGLTISRGRERPKNANTVTTDDGEIELRAYASASPTKKPVEARPDHSDAVLRNLTACRAAATAATLMRDPTRAVAVLVSTLAHNMFGWGYSQTVKVSFSEHLDTWTKAAPQLKNSAHYAELEAEQAFWEGKFNDAKDHNKDATFLDVALGLSPEEVTQFLAFATVVSIDGVTGQITHENRSTEQKNAEFARTHSVDMANFWQPTAADYFDSVKKDVMFKALEEAGIPSDAIAGVKGAKKKAEGTAKAEELMKGKGWLPEPLR